MKKLKAIAVALLLVGFVGCVSQRDREVKAHREEDYERYHKQLEEERALDAYRHSAAFKAEQLKQLNQGMFGTQKKEQVIPQ